MHTDENNLLFRLRFPRAPVAPSFAPDATLAMVFLDDGAHLRLPQIFTYEVEVETYGDGSIAYGARHSVADRNAPLPINYLAWKAGDSLLPVIVD